MPWPRNIPRSSTPIPARSFTTWRSTPWLPPFDDRRARRAVAYWINRSDLASDPAGAGYGQVTCQLLPPDLYGHVTYCPYTRNAGNARVWSTPDLGKAQRLIRESGTLGERVSVLKSDVASEVVTLRHVVESLHTLGYRATLEKANDSRSTNYQVALGGWEFDYPAASNVIEPQLTCHDDSYNLSNFCALQPAIEQTLDAQVVEPAGANQKWAAIDRAVVDDAPVVPFSTNTRHDLTSTRVGNYQYNPQWEALIDQLWVQ